MAESWPNADISPIIDIWVVLDELFYFSMITLNHKPIEKQYIYIIYILLIDIFIASVEKNVEL